MHGKSMHIPDVLLDPYAGEVMMSLTASSRPASLILSQDVVGLAQELRVDSYLPGMAKVLQEMFWDAQTLSATVEEDPEIAGLRNIRFTAEGAWSKEEARQRRLDWNDRTLAICPTTLICTFRLYVHRRKP